MNEKIGPNDPCPCGRLLKYKKCCQPKGIDFNNLSIKNHIRHMTIRAKNLAFLDNLYNILDVNPKSKKIKSWDDLIIHVKKALTPQAVSSIHQVIPQIWPDNDDYWRCMEIESGRNSGLFIGSYLFDSTLSLINKYGLYEDCIMMIDPLPDPRTIAEEYNPVINPEMHTLETLNNILIWMEFEPWIHNGFVTLTRNPADFDYQLGKETMLVTKARYETAPPLQGLEDKDYIPEEVRAKFFEQYKLLTPDSQIELMAKENNLDVEQCLRIIRKERLTSPYYIDGSEPSQLLRINFGTNYELAKYLCSKINSHVLTDLKIRWIEIEYDRLSNNVENPDWETFSRHFQQLNMHYLNGLKTIDVLKLRQDGHLERMRNFLKKLWLRSNPDSASEKHIIEAFQLELDEEIRIAGEEWKNIGSNLSKWFLPNLVPIGLSVIAGTPLWVPEVHALITGISTLKTASKKETEFVNKYPAGFFLEKGRK